MTKWENTGQSKKAMSMFETELKLSVNQRLFEQGYLTEEIYTKAKELIIKKS